MTTELKTDAKYNFPSVLLKEVMAEKPRNGLYKPKEFQGNGNRWLKMKNVFENRIIFDQKMERINVTKNEEEKFSCKNGDLVFGRTSLVFEGVGKCCLVDNITDKPIFESNTFVVRLDQSKYDPKFCFYYFNSVNGRSNIYRIIRQTAASQITSNDLIELSIPYPELKTQKKISSILWNLDLVILNLKIQNKVLEQTAQAIFKSWFVDFDGVTEFDDSEIGQIPKGWDITTLSNLTSFDTGGTWGKETFDNDSNSPAFCIRGMNIPEIRSGNDSKTRLLYGKPSAQEKRKLFPHDIVIEISGGSSTQLTGRSLLITEKLLSRFQFSLLPASFCKLIRLEDKKFSFFAYFLLRWIYDVGIINQYETGTTAIKNFQYTIFSHDYKFVLSPSQIIDEFNQMINSLFNAMDNNTIQFQKLTKIRDALLPKLMSGEIRV